MKNSEIFSNRIDPYDTLVQLIEFANTTNENMKKIQADIMLIEHRITAIELVLDDIIKRNELNS